MNNLISWVAAASAFFAALTALANFLAVRKSQRTSEVQVFLEFSDRYRSEAVSYAISKLASFWRENQEVEDVGKFFLEIEKRDRGCADEIYKCCRVMFSYFMYIARLYIGGNISKTLAIELIAHPGLNVHYKVVKPIFLAKYPNDKKIRKEFRTLERLQKKFGDGIF